MNPPSADNPGPPSQWSSDYFRDASAGGSPLGRGLVGHVPIVGILLILQGVLEILFGSFFVFFCAVITLTNNEELAPLKGLGILMLIISVPALGCGILRLVAGYANLYFRRRTLGIVALSAGLLTLMTGYCAPTSIALAIYGLIVYVNESVIAAFAMAGQGKTSAEIQAAFPPLH